MQERLGVNAELKSYNSIMSKFNSKEHIKL